MLRAMLLLFCLYALPVAAQESAVTIAASDETGYLVNTSQFVWLDNDTLLFEPSRTPGAVGAYEYRVSTNEVTRLDVSPLYFMPTPTRVEHYQIQTTEPDFSLYSFRSPFSFPSFLEYPLHNVIYLSSLRIACGFECPGGIIMAGVHDDQPDYTDAELTEHSEISPINYINSRRYHPLNVKASGGFGVHWSRQSSAAILEVNHPYGAGARLYYANFFASAFGVYGTEVFVGNVFPEFGTYLYALSEDGTRGIYGEYQPEELSQESLRVWEVIPATSDMLWSAQIHPPIYVNSNSDAQDAFAGANFIPGDANHILVLHSDGIMLINLVTDEREILNAAINAQAYQLGVFSPDNRHLAVVTQAGDVLVLPTGID